MTRPPRRWHVRPAHNGDGSVVLVTGHVRQAASADVVVERQLTKIVEEHTQGTLYLDLREVRFLNLCRYCATGPTLEETQR